MNGPFAALLVDSARSPPATGRRGSAVADRQLVYRHEGVQVDLLLQCASPAAAFVWGQVSRSGSGAPCDGVEVSWVEGVGPAAAATTDSFGEFSLSAPVSGLGALAVDAAAGRFLCLIDRAPAIRAATPAQERTA